MLLWNSDVGHCNSRTLVWLVAGFVLLLSSFLPDPRDFCRMMQLKASFFIRSEVVEEGYDRVAVNMIRMYSKKVAASRDCCLLEWVLVNKNIVCF